MVADWTFALTRHTAGFFINNDQDATSHGYTGDAQDLLVVFVAILIIVTCAICGCYRHFKNRRDTRIYHDVTTVTRPIKVLPARNLDSDGEDEEHEEGSDVFTGGSRLRPVHVRPTAVDTPSSTYTVVTSTHTSLIVPTSTIGGRIHTPLVAVPGYYSDEILEDQDLSER